MTEKTDVERLFNQCVTGVPVRLTITCRGFEVYHDVVIKDKKLHNKYAASLFCVSLDYSQGGYFWIHPRYKDTKWRVKSVEALLGDRGR